MSVLAVKRVDEETFSRMRAEWDALLDSSESRNIFLTWEWLHNWWKYIALPTNELFLFEARDVNGSLLGLLPFYAGGIGGAKSRKVLRFLGDEIVSSDYLDFIIRAGEEERVIKGFVDHLFRGSDRVSRYCWTDMIAGTGNALYLVRLLQKRGIPFLEKKKEVCPFLRLPSNRKEFQQQLSPNMRSSFSRRCKKFDREYGTAPHAIDSPTEIGDAYRILFSLHKARWNSKGKTGNLRTDKVQRFHLDVGAAFLEKGWLRFYLLNAGEKPVGALYCFEYKKRVSYYQAGFNPDFVGWSPGLILLGKGMEDAITRGVDEFDFLRGDEDYKWRWTKDFRETMSVIAYPDTFGGHLRCRFDRAMQLGKIYTKKMISGFSTVQKQKKFAGKKVADRD